jgi:hypothetical protein
MTRVPLFKSAGLLLCTALFTLSAQTPTEKKIAPKDLPAPVKAAFDKQFPGAKVLGLSSEVDNGATFYEVESVQYGTHRDVLYKPDGQLIVVEETIAMSDVPPAVQAALKTHFPKAKVTLSEKLLTGQTIEYEFQLKGAPKKEAKFSADGKLLASE